MLVLIIIVLLYAAEPQRVAPAWNDYVASSERAYRLSLELESSLHAHPPAKATDPHRAKLYDLIIAERKRQVRDLEMMRENDR